MNELVQINQFDVTKHINEIDSLLLLYDKQKESARRIVAFFESDDIASTFGHFFNHEERQPTLHMSFDHAIKELNSNYWQRLMTVTDLMRIMPADRQVKWREMITKREAPMFERDLVYGTIEGLSNAQARFFAERIDGLFRALSRDHVTNCPEGFSKRMIFTRVVTDWHHGFYSWDMVARVTDLRMVISSIFGEDPDYNTMHDMTKIIFQEARFNYGSWTYMDGGTLKIKLFKNGNAHFEVHPEVAFQLNRQLALLHPTAIPSEFRIKPTKKSKEFKPIEKPLPHFLLGLLQKSDYGLVKNPMFRGGYREREYIKSNRLFGIYPHTECDKRMIEMYCDVMESVGGVREDRNGYFFFFDHDPKPLIDAIITIGKIPDDKSYQFYPTPKEIAEYVSAIANVQEGHTVLEPSAGTGNLIKPLRLDCKVTAVELSKLRCEALSLMENIDKTVQADFMKYEPDEKFDRILMNPPYNKGQCVDHVSRAVTYLKDDGVLVAVVPLSFHESFDGCNVEDLKTFHNLFDNTSISVKVVKISRVLKTLN